MTWFLILTIWHASGDTDRTVVDYNMSGPDCIFAAESLVGFLGEGVEVTCEMEGPEQ